MDRVGRAILHCTVLVTYIWKPEGLLSSTEFFVKHTIHLLLKGSLTK